jgi:TRAP-type C4-dicarboxylate transport system substrate-binding protein
MMAMVPLLQGVYLPFAFENVDQLTKAYDGESLAIIDKALAKKHVKLIFPMYLDAVNIFSNKASITKIEDFKGLRVLSTSPMFSEILAALGAAPDTSIPQTEQYMALKRSVSDSMAQSIVGGYFQKSYEVAPYITKINMSYPTTLTCMNLKVWNKLPKDVQEVMITAGKKQSAYTLAASKGWEQKFTGALSQAGATVTTIAPEEREKIKAVAKPIWEKWAKENGKDAQRLLELNLKQ